MFTPEEVKAAVVETLKENVVFKSHRVFGPEDFTSSASEQFIHLITASKSACKDALTFWIKCQEVMVNHFENNRDEYDYLALFERAALPIDRYRFNQEMKNINHGLKANLALPKFSENLYQIQFEADELEIVLMMEQADEWILINWYSTA